MPLAKTLYNQTEVAIVQTGTPEPPKIKVGKTPIEIALGIDEQGRTTAKKLYAFLELSQAHYAKWCRKNITENDFAEENVDYIIFTLKGEKSQSRGRPTVVVILPIKR